MQFTGDVENDDLPLAQEDGWVMGSGLCLRYFDKTDYAYEVMPGDYVIVDQNNCFDGIIRKQVFEKLFEEVL